MAEEQKADVAAKKEGSAGGLIFKIAIVAVILVVPVIAGLVTWKLVIAPQMKEKKQPVAAAASTENGSKIPVTAVTVAFDQQYASLIPSDPQYPAATLVYSVGLECANQQTADIVNAHHDRFLSVITEKHRHLNRDQAEDRLLSESIEKQIKIECNDLLQRYQEKPDPSIKILDVFHSQWYVSD